MISPVRRVARWRDLRRNGRMLHVTVTFTVDGSDDLVPPAQRYLHQLPRPYRLRAYHYLGEYYSSSPLINTRWPWTSGTRAPWATWADHAVQRSAYALLRTRGDRWVIRDRPGLAPAPRPRPSAAVDDDMHNPPDRTPDMIAAGQVWAWMNDPDSPTRGRWEIRGTGVKR